MPKEKGEAEKAARVGSATEDSVRRSRALTGLSGLEAVAAYASGCYLLLPAFASAKVGSPGGHLSLGKSALAGFQAVGAGPFWGATGVIERLGEAKW